MDILSFFWGPGLALVGLGQLLNSATFKAIGAKGVTLAGFVGCILDVGKVETEKWERRARLPGFGLEEKHVWILSWK